VAITFGSYPSPMLQCVDPGVHTNIWCQINTVWLVIFARYLFRIFRESRAIREN